MNTAKWVIRFTFPQTAFMTIYSEVVHPQLLKEG